MNITYEIHFVIIQNVILMSILFSISSPFQRKRNTLQGTIENINFAITKPLTLHIHHTNHSPVQNKGRVDGGKNA